MKRFFNSFKVAGFGCLLGLACGTASAGGIGGDVQSFFNSINYQSNVTNPGIYQGQQAGYYTGGGIYARTPNRNYNLATIQAPNFRAGCGGIDLYSGGFSFINSEQFTAMLQSIGSNATSLAFMLALEVVSPQIHGTIAEIQHWAQQFNNNQINSCNAAEQGLGGALSLFGADEQSCVMQRMANAGEDYGTADTNCRNDPSNTGGSASAGKGLPFTNGNIAWQSMMKIDFFSQDLSLSQVVMNLTGTLIITGSGTSGGSDPAPSFQRVASMLETTGEPSAGSLLDALLHGGNLTVTGCTDASTDPASCLQLNPTMQVSITASQALVPQVQSLLSSILDKITSESTLTSQELGLLNSTSLPVYKFVTVASAYNATIAQQDINVYAELIAKDLLYSYLMDLIKKVNDGASHMASQSNQEPVKEFLADVRHARQSVASADSKVSTDFRTALDLTQRTQNYERALIGQLSPQVMQSALYQAQE